MKSPQTMAIPHGGSMPKTLVHVFRGILTLETIHYLIVFTIPFWLGTRISLVDFKTYLDAIRRFLGDPTTLYVFNNGAEYSGYFYPPPSVAFFLPVMDIPIPFLYTLVLIAEILATILAVRLLLSVIERERGVIISPIVRHMVYLFTLASASMFQNLRCGQIMPFVLLTCVGFLYLISNNRPFAAGMVISLGFWLKVYPIIMLAVAFRSEKRWQAVAGCAVGLVIVPVLLAPIIPFGVYRQFFVEILPMLSNTVIPGTLNQSFPAMVARIGTLPDSVCYWYPLPISPLNKALTALVGAVSLGWWLFRGGIRKRDSFILFWAGLLAFLAPFSTYGWEYAYMLSLPLVAIIIANTSWQAGQRRWLVFAVMLIFTIPKLPDGLQEAVVYTIPDIFQHIFYARFLIATCLLFLLVPGMLQLAERREWVHRALRLPTRRLL